MNRQYSPHHATWLNRPPPIATPMQARWLTAPGALTARLRKLGPVTVRVALEASEGATPDEAEALGVHAHAPVWVREVVLLVSGHPCVAARSVTPLADSHSVWQAIRRLRSRPLADLLYHDRTIQRSSFASAILQRAIPLHDVAQLAWSASPAVNNCRPRFLARRSVFVRAGRPLLVAEAFMPDFWLREAPTTARPLPALPQAA
ncbi:chorismate lyase [Pigmentiphaga aceris]|uniref:Probable chorismate pyruvate-lyase n=1 Tax=Pigmentiphaga aceris TaxID=1940612 RepID=A0A5C0B269_9BURK|nr:chorismate lyase [Pigmentiphaga aceris]QEI08004.1 chorismate lyase [Pigmentiphaga aceris]